MEAIKQCPFCGGHSSIEQEDGTKLSVISRPIVEETKDGDWRIICYACLAIISDSDRDVAIQRWNHRADEGEQASMIDDLHSQILALSSERDSARKQLADARVRHDELFALVAKADEYSRHIRAELAGLRHDIVELIQERNRMRSEAARLGRELVECTSRLAEAELERLRQNDEGQKQVG